MRLKQNSCTAIVVKKSWANLGAIQAFLRERPRTGDGQSAAASSGNLSCHSSGKSLSGTSSSGKSVSGKSSFGNSSFGNSSSSKSLDKSPGNGHGMAERNQAGPAADDGHTIFVRVLDDTDERGLWIELNTKEHERDRSVELQAMLIPWHAVLAVVVGDKFAGAGVAADRVAGEDAAGADAAATGVAATSGSGAAAGETRRETCEESCEESCQETCEETCEEEELELSPTTR